MQKIETWQVADLDMTQAAPRKFLLILINWSRNDSPTPPVCSLQSAFCTHRLEQHLIIGYSFSRLRGNKDQYCGLFFGVKLKFGS